MEYVIQDGSNTSSCCPSNNTERNSCTTLLECIDQTSNEGAPCSSHETKEGRHKTNQNITSLAYVRTYVRTWRAYPK
jgi:hypothetical protein